MIRRVVIVPAWGQRATANFYPWLATALPAVMASSRALPVSSDLLNKVVIYAE